jgi:hypothetical protein
MNVNFKLPGKNIGNPSKDAVPYVQFSQGELGPAEHSEPYSVPLRQFCPPETYRAMIRHPDHRMKNMFKF